MTWAAVRDALVAAVKTATGLNDAHIIWGYQGATQPTGPYVSLSLSPSSNPGQDGTVRDTDLGRPAGQEIRTQGIGFREVTLEVQVFSDVVVSSNAAADPLEIAENVRSALRLQGVRDIAALAGVSFVDLSGPVQYVPAVVAVNFRGRATYAVRCFVPASAALEYVGYIAHVSGTQTIHGGPVDPETVSFTEP